MNILVDSQTSGIIGEDMLTAISNEGGGGGHAEMKDVLFSSRYVEMGASWRTEITVVSPGLRM